jgi:hypothetical protein
VIRLVSLRWLETVLFTTAYFTIPIPREGMEPGWQQCQICQSHDYGIGTRTCEHVLPITPSRSLHRGSSKHSPRWTRDLEIYAAR